MRKICQRDECNIEFEPRWRNNIYCSRSCSAKVNNSRYPKRPPAIVSICADCGTLLSSTIAVRCRSCHLAKNRATNRVKNQGKVQEWIAGTWSGDKGVNLSPVIRNYLLEQSGCKCSKCGFSAFHPDDGRTILEINHINGDGSDHRPENLEVLCPNCHALTSNYKSRNMGHGRPYIYRIVAPELGRRPPNTTED